LAPNSRLRLEDDGTGASVLGLLDTDAEVEDFEFDFDAGAESEAAELEVLQSPAPTDDEQLLFPDILSEHADDETKSQIAATASSSSSSSNSDSSTDSSDSGSGQSAPESVAPALGALPADLPEAAPRQLAVHPMSHSWGVFGITYRRAGRCFATKADAACVVLFYLSSYACSTNCIFGYLLKMLHAMQLLNKGGGCGKLHKRM
jgi:hypothetical protein